MNALAERFAVFPKQRRHTTSDGIELAYTVLGEQGSGTPLVLMNGWTCADCYFRTIAPSVAAAGHPVLLFDSRGHGLSRPAPEDVSALRLATDLIELVDAAGWEQAVLSGHSMGVQAIFEAWRVDPSRIAGLAPIAGTYENPVPTFRELAVLDRLFPLGNALLSRLPLSLTRYPMAYAHHLPASLTMRVLRALGVANETVTYRDVEPHVRQFSGLDLAILWRMMAELREHSAADLLPDIHVPVLILAGQKDSFTPPSVQRRMDELLPDSELVFFEDGGHLLPVEEADGVASALISFLARVGPAPFVPRER